MSVLVWWSIGVVLVFVGLFGLLAVMQIRAAKRDREES